MLHDLYALACRCRDPAKPIVLITGADGNIGRSLADALADDCTVVEQRRIRCPARPGTVLRDMWTGGVSFPWNLAGAAAIGLWLMFTRVTLGAKGAIADADHLVGALVLTIVSLTAAEVARPLRFLLMPLGAALFVTPFIADASAAATALSMVCGAALILLSFRRGPIGQSYGARQMRIV